MNNDPRYDQRLRALAVGNAKRSEMKDLREQIRKRRMSPVIALETRDVAMTTERFLTAIPSIGRVKANRIAQDAGLSLDALLGGRRAGQSGARRRVALAATLRSRELS